MRTHHWKTAAVTAAAALSLAGTAAVTTAGTAHAVAGRSLVTATSAASSANKSVTATCPAGSSVAGAGGQILDGFGNVILTDVVPDAALTSVTVTGSENNAFPGNWRVQAQAMCIPTGSVGYLQRISIPSSQDGTSATIHGSLGSCPVGTRLYGLGWSLPGTNGNVTPYTLQPNAALTQVLSRAVETRPYAPTWNYATYLVCGVGRPTMVLTTAASATSSLATHTAVTGTCPPGTTLTGGGAMTQENGAVGDIHLDRLTLDLAGNSATSTGREDPVTPTANTWADLAYGICGS